MFIWVILGCYGLALAILYVTTSRGFVGEAKAMHSRGASQEEIDLYVIDSGQKWFHALIQGAVVLGTVIAAFACLVGWLVTS